MLRLLHLRGHERLQLNPPQGTGKARAGTGEQHSRPGGGAEFTFEAIGSPRTVEQSFATAARGGIATVIGMLPLGARVEIDGTELLLGEKRLQGSLMGSNVFRRDLPQLVDLSRPAGRCGR